MNREPLHDLALGERVVLGETAPLALASGAVLERFPLAYRTYGRLNAARSNVILVAHALSGDQIVAGRHPLTGRPGWWDRLVGPGRILDTERFFILCANVPGGCMGSVGPKSVDPATGRAYGPDFPGLMIADMVRAQALLLDHLGIEEVFLVIGGSMGGMQALEWLRLFPERVFAAAAFAVGARHSAQQIALHAIGRQAILGDPDYQQGRYYGTGRAPVGGLAVARMLAHLSYRSPQELEARFGRALQDRTAPSFGFGVDYQVESYLAHHGHRFVERFDPLSYLVITKAMDHFDLAPEGEVRAVFEGRDAPVFLAAYDTDWLYPPAETAALAAELAAAGLEVDFAVHEALTGHDSFLLEVPSADRALARFIARCAARRAL